MSDNTNDSNDGCPVELALDVISGKWKGHILHHLLSNTLRFSELRRLMPQVSQKMLTKQLRELEADGIISREVYPEVPSKVEYSITAYGSTLEPIIVALRAWGIKHHELHPRSNND